jgi:hypothetical protein
MAQVGCAYGTSVWWPQHSNHYAEQKMLENITVTLMGNCFWLCVISYGSFELYPVFNYSD